MLGSRPFADEVYASHYNDHRIAQLWAEFPVSNSQMRRLKQDIQPNHRYVRSVLSARQKFRRDELPAPNDTLDDIDFKNEFLKEMSWLTATVDQRCYELEPV